MYRDLLATANGFTSAGIRAVIPAPIPSGKEGELKLKLDENSAIPLAGWSELEAQEEASLFDISSHPATLLLNSGGSLVGLQVCLVRISLNSFYSCLIINNLFYFVFAACVRKASSTHHGDH